MKKIVLSLILLACTCTLIAQETNEEKINEKGNTFKNSLKVHPLNIFVNELVLEYERVIRKKSSLIFTLGLGYEDGDFIPSGTFEEYLIFSQVDYRYYFSKSKIAPKGFFVSGGAFGFYEHIRYKDLFRTVQPNINQDFFTAGISGDIGYQWVFKKRITIGISGGADLQIPLNYDNSSTKVRPDLNVAIGYSW